ncbi:MAG: DUF5606 domain-containing protein [Saprospiraceae bacterium]|nr:DUF5606 domain-containing protein [Saprospiraceae bacterium]
MNLEKYLAVAGTPGIHKVIATRSNGFIIEDRNENRTRFVPLRQSQVTPLGTVGIYTYDAKDGDGTTPLGDVFTKMLDAIETTPTPAPDANSVAFREYFVTVLPEHDRDRVHINDIKKCVKWFNYMLNKGMFEEIKAADAKESEGDITAEEVKGGE